VCNFNVKCNRLVHVKMRDETFSVKYISVRNCFLRFSERWLEKLKDTNALVSV
jgi:hypothetical protein